MGNCQAVDAATLVIQYPSGKVEKFYWPVNASEIMKMNPGHYVALLLSTTLYPTNNNNNNGTSQCPNKTTTSNTAAAATSTTNNNNSNNNSLRITRIKLLRPTDTLALGHVYRLITSEEVMKGLWAKKQAKQRKNLASESSEKPVRLRQVKHGSGLDIEVERSELEKNYEVNKNERNRARTATASATNSTSNNAARSRTWQPSLQSISEAASK